jgi:hypothetical protein
MLADDFHASPVAAPSRSLGADAARSRRNARGAGPLGEVSIELCLMDSKHAPWTDADGGQPAARAPGANGRRGHTSLGGSIDHAQERAAPPLERHDQRFRLPPR